MEFPPPLWTGVYAGILGLLQIVLSLRSARQRYRTLTNVDMTAEGEMGRRIRAQASLAEYAPIALILLGFTEIAYGSVPLIVGLGALLVLARLCHAWAMARAWRAGRAAGAAGTFIVIAVCGVLQILRPWLSLQPGP